jgi:hypothetical protein
MANAYSEEESYRVVLHSTGGHTETEKAHFCKEVSDRYGIPLSLMKKISDRCPIVIKKDLPFKKAKLLAIAFKAFGASVSVEKKKKLPPIFLEFSADKNWRVELDSSHLRKSPGGAWQIFGRVRNIFNEELADLWTLIQLFDEFEDLVAFEEIPLPVNPIPPNESSPFRAIFEGDLPVQKISISFKIASGKPLPARDNREKKEWVEMKIAELEKRTSLPPPAIPSEAVSPPPVVSPPSMVTEIVEERSEEKGLERVSEDVWIIEQETDPMWANREIKSDLEERSTDLLGEHDLQREPLKLEGLQEEFKTSEIIWQVLEKEEAAEAEEELHLDDQTEDRPEEKPKGLDLDLSQVEKPDQSSVTSPAVLEEKNGEEPIPYPWIDEFRKAIMANVQKVRAPFTVWFDNLQKERRFESVYHSLLTLLIYTRFNQTHSSESALENTRKTFNLSLSNDLSIEEIPWLEGTPFFSGEIWRDLYFRAIPKLQEVTHRILEKREWDPFDLDRLIRIIPHMTDRNSHRTIRFIHDRIPEVTVDVSPLPVEITESLYRVASRLGVVNPFFDFYQGKNSMGDLKIQTFARTAFPDNPGRAEELMNQLGAEDEEGPCSTTEPWCQHCPFESFCQKLFTGFNPSEKGMVYRS